MSETFENINAVLSGQNSIPIEIKIETKSIIILSSSILFLIVIFFTCKKFI